MRVLAVLAILALLAAGCSSPPREQPPAPTATDAAQVAATLFQLRDCEGRDAFFAMDDRSVDGQMPDGYRPYMVQGVAGALVDVLLQTCDVAFPDGAVEPRVPMAQVVVLVGAARLYVFEWVVPQAQAPRLFALLQAGGWPVLDGQVSFGPGTVTVHGPEVDYAILEATEPAGGFVPSTVGGGLVHLVHGDGDAAARMDENRTVDGNGNAASPALAATKGALSRFAPGASGSASGGLSFLAIRSSSVFTESPPQEQPIRG